MTEMQAPDQSNSGVFLPAAANSSQISAIGVIPRSAVPQPSIGTFAPRPVFSDNSSSMHSVPVSMTTGLAPSAAVHHPIGQVHGGLGVKPMSGQPLNLITSSSAQALPGTTSANTQPLTSHPSVSSTTGPSSNVLPSAVVPPTLVTHAVTPSVGPPAVPHVGLSGYPNSAAAMPSFVPANSQPHLSQAPPLQPLNNPHRPIQTVQPQVPVVQTMAASGLSQQPGQAQQFQRLKVEDALSYLDQVKLQFGNHPQVYNDFLDIMKEFKSQSIDTPGVISRVSNLFKGHPELIVGFNTFLPPGYKIEVQANDTISVQQPGQPSMSLSQLAGASAREPVSHPSSYKAKGPVNPVNLSTSGPTSAAPTDHPRSGLDNVAAAASGTISSTPGQPVEFNHAINYVNKIKNRFQGQPDIYKNFLEILHKYQKEQKQIKDGQMASKPLTETEVYAQVANLFQHQEDLLKEFGQFLPDANGNGGLFGKGGLYSETREHPHPIKKPYSITGKTSGTSKLAGSGSLRKPGSSGIPPAKKSKLSTISGVYNKDVTLAEAGKYGTLTEYAFFDKVRKALRSQEVYENFLRCLQLFNQEVISHTELVQLVQPFLGKFPELFRRFKDLLGYRESGALQEPIPSSVLSGTHTKASSERMMRDDLAMEIDYSSCKRYGASYRALPKSYHPPRCSGRTSLCREVLNDTWVSFPSWSEESTFVTSRKTQFEESIYRCEDERFELDMVIELNLATIRVLEGVQKKLQRMNSEEAAKFKLDNTLGGTSEVIHRKAIQRIYGDKAVDIIDGLKKNPVVAVPLVLRRLKSKDDEWKEAQRQFNKIWREQNEKYYLKSLDHQGINFKQNDIKSLRSKNLLNEIEAIYDSEHSVRKDNQGPAADDASTLAPTAQEAEKRPHLVFVYRNRVVVDDAMSLIIHHARRQASTQKKDKQLIKQLMRQNVQTLFHRPTYPLSDDDDDEDMEYSEEEQEHDGRSSKSPSDDKSVRTSSRTKTKNQEGNSDQPGGDKPEKSTAVERKLEDLSNENVDRYSLLYANSNWYFFLRLHQILCQRLYQIKNVCDKFADEHKKCKRDKSETVAVALRLKMPNDLEPDQYYSTFLDLVKSLLDGNIESSSYEDQLREMFGIHAYLAFTMDKVIQNVVKQLQYIVADETCRDVTNIWMKEQSGQGSGGLESTKGERSAAEGAYKRKLEVLLSDDNCFEVTMHKKSGMLTMTLLDTDVEGSVATAVAQSDKYSDFIDTFVPGGVDSDVSDEVREHLKQKPIFLNRNLKSWKKHNQSMLEHKNRGKPVEPKPDSNNSKPDADAKDPSSEASSPKNGEKDDTSKDCISNDAMEMTDDLELIDAQECRFNINSFKMIYVVNSEAYLYKRNALTKAKQSHKNVSEGMYRKWSDFCKNWRDTNADTSDMSKVKGWMNGDHLEECRPCQTTCHNDNDLNKAPYRIYNRYSVKYEKVTAAVSSAIDDGSLTALNATADESMDIA